MVLQCHVHGLPVAGSDSNMYDLERYLKMFFKSSPSKERLQYSGCSFVKDWDTDEKLDYPPGVSYRETGRTVRCLDEVQHARIRHH